MSRLSQLLSVVARVLRHWVSLVTIAVVLGAFLGNFVFDTFIGRPSVGVVKINSYLFPWTTPDIFKMLKHAAENKDIKTVVIEMDSPGGDVVSTEELYMQILDLKKKKPIVVYVNMIAASGGYFTAVPADFIYVKPSSMVGSVGAFVSLPDTEPMIEDTAWTGPYKATGSSRKETINQLEMIKQGFLQAVLSNRGERLKISREEISKAGLYNGIEAVRYGLVDEIGSSSDAIKKAAELGRLRKYKVTDINEALYVYASPWWFGSVDRSSGEVPRVAAGSIPVYYYLYTPPEAQE
ncbi:MAG: S49 family peptidase [Chloroflexi bacterium]|nr:S49 family peptidase [Chloroflexota bacterium]